MGDDSFEALAGSLLAMCDFDRPQAGKLFLDPRTGSAWPPALPSSGGVAPLPRGPAGLDGRSWKGSAT